ncbi:hypothetical protein TWF696_007072 [Orbilia brochopaga]|uniref:Uncharacterized protein n=1 Tax=Orbilia brochopaga TaxID=3140254 RepID=A0AAV9UQS2_9PEZI
MMFGTGDVEAEHDGDRDEADTRMKLEAEAEAAMVAEMEMEMEMEMGMETKAATTRVKISHDSPAGRRVGCWIGRPGEVVFACGREEVSSSRLATVPSRPPRSCRRTDLAGTPRM